MMPPWMKLTKVKVKLRSGLITSICQVPFLQNSWEGEKRKKKSFLIIFCFPCFSVVILCASPAKVRSILLAAESIGLLDRGEYVFFNVELFARQVTFMYSKMSKLNKLSQSFVFTKGCWVTLPTILFFSQKMHPKKRSTNRFPTNFVFSRKFELYKPWHDPQASPEENARAKKAYEAVLTVTASSSADSEEYESFAKAVKALSRAKFNYQYEEEVNSFVANFHDAVRDWYMYCTVCADIVMDLDYIFSTLTGSSGFPIINANLAMCAKGDIDLCLLYGIFRCCSTPRLLRRQWTSTASKPSLEVTSSSPKCGTEPSQVRIAIRILDFLSPNDPTLIYLIPCCFRRDWQRQHQCQRRSECRLRPVGLESKKGRVSGSSSMPRCWLGFLLN